QVCVRLTDVAGNTTYAGSTAFDLDTAPPVFTSLALGAADADGYVSAAEHAASTALAGALVASGQAVTDYALAANATACSAATSFGALVPKTDDSGFAGDGAYQVCVRLTDAAGNITYGTTGA